MVYVVIDENNGMLSIQRGCTELFSGHFLNFNEPELIISLLNNCGYYDLSTSRLYEDLLSECQ